MPEIIQNVTVTGSDNEVIVAGRDVYRPVYHLSQPSAEERSDLLRVLELVRQRWIADVLERSVERTSTLDPLIRPEPRKAEQPWERERAAAGPADDSPRPVTVIGDVFDRSGRTLLILGEPGAGKTIALLTLARACIEQAEGDPMAPVPVVLNLSSWARSRESIHDWLATQLYTHYKTGRLSAMRLIERHRLLLLLDGLDEVEEEVRAACVEAIDAFVLEHGIAGLAVCCRRAEYLALPVRLQVGGAVTLLPLTDRQVTACLYHAGEELAGLLTALKGNSELRALAESPLMLNIMSSAFAGLPAEALAFENVPTRDALREQIFARYVDRMFIRRERSNEGFSREWTEGWLQGLAAGMRSRGESIFAIERLQPAWLTARQTLAYTLISRVGAATTLGLAVGLMGLGLVALLVVKASSGGAESGGLTFLAVCVLAGLLSGLLSAPVEYARFRISLRKRSFAVMVNHGFLFQMALLVVIAAVFVPSFWIVSAGAHWWGEPGYPLGEIAEAMIVPFFILGFASRQGRGDVTTDVTLAGPPAWRWEAALRGGLRGGVIAGVPAAALAFTSVLPPAAASLVTFSGLASGFISEGWVTEYTAEERWRRPLHQFAVLTAALSWIMMLGLQMLVARTSLSGIQPVSYVVATAVLIPALYWYDRADLILHAVLREILFRTGTAPRRVGEFLDYATHLGFLQRGGGGYIFIHGLLREHFAARPGVRAPVERP